MQYIKPPQNADLGQPMTVLEYAKIVQECIDQPPWRAAADKEADYADGVLTLTMPVAEEAKPRKVKVGTGGSVAGEVTVDQGEHAGDSAQL